MARDSRLYRRIYITAVKEKFRQLFLFRPNDGLNTELFSKDNETSIYLKLYNRIPVKFLFLTNLLILILLFAVFSTDSSFAQNDNNLTKTQCFELNTKMYPDSFNAWDNLAGFFYKNDDTNMAIKYYKKSLELNPKNKNTPHFIKQHRIQSVDD